MRFVGLDVGGTKVAAGVLDDGVLSEPVIEPTELGSSDALVAQLIRIVRAVGGDAVNAVGIGVPSVVEFATGRIRNSVNIPLIDVPLRALLTERLGVPVFVDNDGSVAALAEAHTAGTRNLVMLTIGTGVGGGVVIDGRVFRGATGAAPELGHQLVAVDCSRGVPRAVPGFPQPGSLESIAAGGALDRLAREAGLDSGRAAVERARAGDAVALEVMRIHGERVGLGIANAINCFDPEEIVIGGGVSAAGELLLEPASRVGREYALPGVGSQTKIRLAVHGNEAGVLGAALLAAQESAIQ
jgi:glucokinase